MNLTFPPALQSRNSAYQVSSPKFRASTEPQSPAQPPLVDMKTAEKPANTALHALLANLPKDVSQAAAVLSNFFNSHTKPTKVGIIGAGNVGQNLAKDLVRNEFCKSVAMVDMYGDVARGKALDLLEACPVYGSNTEVIGSDDYQILEGANLVVVTAGLPRKEGMSREDLLEANARIVAKVSRNIKKYAPDSTIIMVSNPLDVMCHVAQKVSGFPPERVIGMAGVLDSARFRTFIAEALDVAVEDVQATVLGGHGDTMVPLPRYTTVAGVPITKLMDQATLDKLIDRTRNGGGEIVKYLKTSSSVAAGASIAKMVEAILKGKNTVVPCSVQLSGQYGVDGLYVGVPVKLGRDGVEKIVELDLTPEEQALFDKSVAVVRENVDMLPGILQKLEEEQAAAEAQAAK